MNIRFVLYGILIGALWNTESVVSILLTTTLMTGFVGGFLIGKMTLGTFLGLLSTNGTSLPRPQLPQIPSVNLSSILPSFPTLIPREASKNVPASDISDTFITSTTSLPVTPTAAPAAVPQYMMPSYQNMPYVYTYNYPVSYPPVHTYVFTTTRRPKPQQSFELSFAPIKPIDVPISLDNKIRDRFISQLAIMDPLNCLPKIFCEVSADPYGATFIMEHGAIASVGPMGQSTITKNEMAAYEHHLHMQRTTTTTPRPTTTTTTTTISPTAQNDEDEQADSQSGSAEEEEQDEEVEDDVSVSVEEESEEEEDDSFEQYRKEHEHKIEMQALEEMVDEIEDPETYMFILRDKQRRKAARKRYREKHRNDKLSLPSSNVRPAFGRDDLLTEPETSPLELSPLMYDTPEYNEETASSYLHRRMSVEPPLPRPPPPMEPPTFMPPIFKRSSTQAPLDDMFADDPFFDDFHGSSGRSSKSLKGNFENHKKNRKRRQAFQKEDLMKKYKVAYMVAEKYKNPEMCNNAFPSCPYRAETILSVVNRMESGLMPFQLSSDKKNYFTNKNNIVHFKNTLQAIERLNKATLYAQARGEPIDIEEMTEAASNLSSNIDAKTSQNIVKEFQEVVARIKTAKPNKRRGHKPKKTLKNQTKYDAVHYYKKAQMETLKPKERIKTGILHAKEPIKQQDDELQIRKEWSQIPSFKQTYKDMFKASKQKKRGRPKSKSRRADISKSSGAKSKVKTKEDSKPVKKFVHINEDDEKDAKESEEAVDALIVHGKTYRSPLV